jgi:hypothetical protein
LTTTAACRPVCARPSSSTAPAWKTSTTARRAVWIAASSPNWPPANGSARVSIAWSSARPACALAQQACRQGFTTRYLRAPRLFEELRLAHADGGFPKLMRRFANTDLLLLDDWGLMGLDTEGRRDLLELLDDRHGRRATLITRQLPLEHWHDLIGDPTLADAILDRLVHNAYRITLKGESMRKRHARTLTPSVPAE